MTSAFQRLVEYDPESSPENVPALAAQAMVEGVVWRMPEELEQGFEFFSAVT